MSAHDIQAPGFASLAALLSTRVRKANRRIQWAGSSQDDSTETQALTWVIGSTSTWDTVASLTLDPGRWLLMAGTTVDHFMTATDRFSIKSRMLFNGVPSTIIAAESQAGPFGFSGYDRCDPHTLNGTSSFAVETTVAWQVSYRVIVGGGPGHADALHSYLTAVPS